MTSRPDFGRLAAGHYDRVRPVDENWLEVFELVVAEGDLRGRRVLDCGCGTGRLSQALANRWPPRCGESTRSRRCFGWRARNVPPASGLKQGHAEALPFRDGWFDRAVMWLVCHLVDRPAAFRELARVLAPAGRVVVVTFDPAHFGTFWLNPYFPSIESIDRARFPDAAQLEAQLAEAGFTAVQFHRCSQRASITRDQALERICAGHISTFDLLDPDEVREGPSGQRRSCPRRSNMRSNG